MTREEIINGLKMTMELILFDPSTGETKEPHQLNDMDRTTYDACKGAIEALEKQEQDRWIPVTERLPEKEGCYLVAIKNDYNRIYSKTAWIGKDVWFKRQDILAWRPLPEAFEVEEEGATLCRSVREPQTAGNRGFFQR